MNNTTSDSATKSKDSLPDLVKIFKKGDSGKAALFAIAEDCAKAMPRVKTHQLRNLLSLTIKIKQSHTDTAKSLITDVTLGKLATMRPRIAYMAAKKEGLELRPVQQELDSLLRDTEAFKTGEDLERLYEFVEALVAFHKYYNPERTNR